jgi:hypothetical protein
MAMADQDGIEEILEIAAERLGDPTEAIFERVRRNLGVPSLRFFETWPADVPKLKGMMVEEAIFCIMNWRTTRAEIEIILVNTIPHHCETLQLEPAVFISLLEASFDVLGEAAHDASGAAKAAWGNLRTDLCGFVSGELAGLRAA